jgi:lipopolysaccharide heptosyltransferase II
MEINNKIVKNILVVRNDRFGEFLLNIPALRALKETFVNAKIIMIVDPYVKDIAEAIPFIDEIIEWAPKKEPLREKIRIVKLLRKKKVDIAIMLNPSKEFNIISFFSGIPVRVGFARKLHFLLNRKIEDKKYLGQKHEVEYNLEMVNLVGAKTKDKAISLKIDDAIINDIKKEFGIVDANNLIAIHPWTSDPVKQWPQENFYLLTKRLLEDKSNKIIIIGGIDVLDAKKEIFDNLGSNLINLTGRTTLKQLAALLKGCKLLISVDSGPMHLACAVSTPVIAIFRGNMPSKSARRWGPWGNGHIVIEKDNLDDITVDEVLNKTRGKLNK